MDDISSKDAEVSSREAACSDQNKNNNKTSDDFGPKLKVSHREIPFLVFMVDDYHLKESNFVGFYFLLITGRY